MLFPNWYSSSFRVRKQKTGKLATQISQGIFLSVVFTIGGCRSQPRPISEPAIAPTPVAPSPSPKPSAIGKTVTLNIYQLDNQCNKFLSTKTAVSANQPVTQAIAKTLEKANSDVLDVAGYRVRVKAGVATLDLRPTATAKRSLRSLSNCEQLALFGSLRRTLTQNPRLKIKSVQFTDRGQPITPQ